MSQPSSNATARKTLGILVLAIGLLTLGTLFLMLRLTVATDFMYHAMVKDPVRVPPEGPVMVSPADGVVLYVRRIEDGVIPEVVKRGVPVPVVDHLKDQPIRPFKSGWLIGIYMNTHGVHVNYLPTNGILRKQYIYNGPHMDMTDAEVNIILNQMMPGMVTAKKALGMEPYALEENADFILESARETLALEDERGKYTYIVRIADYWVGKILTWVAEGDEVSRGQKLGMITWGSQTDLFIEDSPGLEIEAEVGDYLYGGVSIVATY